MFAEGRLTAVNHGARRAISLGEAVVFLGRVAPVPSDARPGKSCFVVGLDAGHTYQVEVDDEEMFEGVTTPAESSSWTCRTARRWGCASGKRRRFRRPWP